jgi:hypothetical protein
MEGGGAGLLTGRSGVSAERRYYEFVHRRSADAPLRAKVRTSSRRLLRWEVLVLVAGAGLLNCNKLTVCNQPETGYSACSDLPEI